MATLKTKIQLRRDTADNLKDVKLEVGEPGYATDTKKFVIGDGNTKFSELKDYGFTPDVSDFVTGPTNATDNAIAIFDGTTGKLIQNSTVVIDDSGNTTLPVNATLKLNTYGTRFITLSGNNITADMSNETGGWAGAFASVKDPSGTTTTMLGWYGSTALNHIYMGGAYDDPYMKMTAAGLFTFKNQVTINAAQGTAPLAVTSTTVNTNLNADLLDGKHASEFALVGDYLPKTTYEWNKEFAAGSNGAISLGRYNLYDTQLTFDITTTTSTTISGKLVIAAQNGNILKATVYGDASNTLAGYITIYQSAITGSRSWIEVFCNFPGWSKNKVHIYAVALNSKTVTRQMASVTFSNGVPSGVTSGDTKWAGTIVNDITTYDASHSGIGTCTTAAATAAKVVTLPRFALVANATILVRVSTTNSATSDVTLNVNSTGAKSIYIGGSAWSTSNQLNAGDYLATYDDSNNRWNLTRIYLTDNNTTYGADRGISLVSGKFGHSNTAITEQTTKGLYKISYDAYGHITGTESFTLPTKDSWNYDDIYVKYNAAQNLTDAQKTQARANIGAGTSSFSGSYNDLTNKPSIPDPTNCYWANIKVASTSSKTTEPIFAKVGVAEKTTIQYNTTEGCLEFVFS